MCYQHLPRRRLQTVQRYHGDSNARCSLRLLSAFRRSVARDLPQPRRLCRTGLVDEVGKYSVFDIEQLSATPVLDEVAMIEDDL